jgi:hypothetical protein
MREPNDRRPTPEAVLAAAVSRQPATLRASVEERWRAGRAVPERGDFPTALDVPCGLYPCGADVVRHVSILPVRSLQSELSRNRDPAWLLEIGALHRPGGAAAP